MTLIDYDHNLRKQMLRNALNALGRRQPLSSSEVSLASKSNRMVWLGACSAPKLRAAALPLGSLRPETGPEEWALIITSEQGP